MDGKRDEEMNGMMLNCQEERKQLTGVGGIENGETENPDEEGGREMWSKQIEFMLSCIGFAVGLGNIWRFPYLCYKNGGGAFLIPYFICLLFGGVPIFILEVGLGQYMKHGGLGAWRLVPLFQGIGVAAAIVVFYLNLYYIIILAWDLYYLGMSFTSVLPWSHCNNTWNTPRCTVFTEVVEPCFDNSNNSLGISNSTLTGCGHLNTTVFNETVGNFTATRNHVDPVIEFWENKILHISDGIDKPGGIVWELAVCLLIVWIVCYFCIWRGVKWTGKVVYFTAVFPYIILSILLVRGVTLDGAADGIVYYLNPVFTRLLDAQVWIDGGTQVFFSYAIALGAMISLGSYNRFHNNFVRDCCIIAGINSCTSIYGGIAIFSVLGFMAKQQGVPIDEVAESGPGLAFIAYPKAVTQMPLSVFWAILFFVMIFLLGLDSQFVGVEAFITTIMDVFPSIRNKTQRAVVVAIYCAISFLIGLSMVTEGGMYVFQLMDYYSASGFVLLWICLFEAVAIAWVFKCSRFYDCIEMMVGYRMGPFLSICWTFLTPLVTMGILLFSIVSFQPLTYNRTYHYPPWAQAVGILMAVVSMLSIPLFMAIKLFTTPGSLLQRWRTLTTPILRQFQIPVCWKEHNEYKWSIEKKS
ncbi:hypothetical protein ScPMuIL_011764 [Solemya velum]